MKLIFINYYFSMNFSDSLLEHVLNLSHVEEYNRSCTGNVLSECDAERLISKISFDIDDKQCGICGDDEYTWELPCCKTKDKGNTICKDCLINTLTKTSFNCPFCRDNIITNINSVKNNASCNRKRKHTDGEEVYMKTSIDINQNIIKVIISNKDEIKKKPLCFKLHNITKQQRNKIYLFAKQYKKIYNKLYDKYNLWDELYEICRKFKNKHKHKTEIDNNKFDIFINNLNVKLFKNYLDEKNIYYHTNLKTYNKKKYNNIRLKINKLIHQT